MTHKALMAGAFRRGDVLLLEDAPDGPRRPFIVAERLPATPRLGEVTLVSSSGVRRTFGALDPVDYASLNPAG